MDHAFRAYLTDHLRQCLIAVGLSRARLVLLPDIKKDWARIHFTPDDPWLIELAFGPPFYAGTPAEKSDTIAHELAHYYIGFLTVLYRDFIDRALDTEDLLQGVLLDRIHTYDEVIDREEHVLVHLLIPAFLRLIPPWTDPPQPRSKA